MIEDKTVSCYNDHARAYDLYQSTVVPHYHEMLEMVARTCQRYLAPDARIIDLGCGTGNASLAILKSMRARICLIDGSANMLGIACEKIGSAAPDSISDYRVEDLSRNGWDQELSGGEYDAVVSTLVLEHLPFNSYGKALEGCFRLLKPGGWLLAVEGYEEEGSDMLQWFNEEMQARRSKLYPDISAETSDSITRLRDEKEVHYFCSKARKAAWWQEAGFSRVNVLWQYLCVALMAGQKPL